MSDSGDEFTVPAIDFTAVQETSEQHHTHIKLLNIAALLVHFVFFLLVCIYALPQSGKAEFPIIQSVPVYSNGTISHLVHKHIGTFKVAAALFCECTVTVIAHLIYTVPATRRAIYKPYITAGAFYRWVEYSITAPLVWIIVYVFCGVTSVDAIVLAVFCIVAMQWLGYCTYSTNRISSSQQNMSMIIACILMLVLMSLMFGVFSQTHGENDVPDFVPGIMAAIVVLYCSFGVNRLYTFFQGDEEFSCLKEEKRFIVLSLTSKVILRAVLISRVFV